MMTHSELLEIQAALRFAGCLAYEDILSQVKDVREFRRGVLHSLVKANGILKREVGASFPVMQFVIFRDDDTCFTFPDDEKLEQSLRDLQDGDGSDD